MAFLDGLLGQPENYGGLLDQTAVDAAQRNGRMALAAQLLQASGPSTQRTSFGQNLGGAITAGMAAQGNSTAEAIKAKLVQAQIAKAMAPQQQKLISYIDPVTGKPVLGTPQQALGNQPYAAGTSEAKPAATIQEYNLYEQQMKAAGQQPLSFEKFLRLRTEQVTQGRGSVNEVGGVPTYVTTQGPNRGDAAPLTTLPAEAAGQGAIAGAKAGAQATGEATAKASFDLPRLEQNTQQALDDIQKLRSAPGLKYITGLYSKAPVVPGTDQAAADAMAKQVQGQTFLQAYNTLKGGGAITEVEGSKAEAAIARLQRAQSTKDYQSALDDLSSVLQKGLARAKTQAGSSAAPVAQPKRVKVDAQGNVIGN